MSSGRVPRGSPGAGPAGARTSRVTDGHGTFDHPAYAAALAQTTGVLVSAESTATSTSADAPWATAADEVTSAHDTDSQQGLDADRAARLLDEHGPNEVARDEGISTWQILLQQFLDPIVYVLGAAGAAAAIAGEVVEAIAVVIAVLIQAAIGFATELRAKQSVDALEEMGRTTAMVVRDGTPSEVDAAEVVPGDVVLLEEGDVVPADLRLVETANLQTDEAALTGESEPRTKQVEPVDSDAPLAERSSMAYRGTQVTVGSGRGVVTATGEDTELGAVAVLVSEAGDDTKPPIEQQLDKLGKVLIGAVIGVGVVVAVAGLAVGRAPEEIIPIAIALAVAAVPEGLPVVATLALARGVVRMSRRNALVKQLASVETLGSAGVIFSDKTGTLTEGRMEARRLLLPDGVDVDLLDAGTDVDDTIRAALLVGSLCGNATINEDGDDVGDPMELALQRAAEHAGIEDRADLLAAAPERWEEAFDRDTRMMATAHDHPDEDFYDEHDDGVDVFGGGDVLVAVKGAPEDVLAACTSEVGGRELDDERRREWIEREEALAGEGLRVLGLARATTQRDPAEPYHDLELLGMVGLLDPPREATRDAVAQCHRAGVRVVMVTGDQPSTAAAIARQVGLVGEDEQVGVVPGREVPPSEQWDDETRTRLAEATVFARLEPRQKLDLIDLAQSRGDIVGMTGDGVNDAPALEKADIGIAMGDKGTQVARDAADIVLQDDAFESIVAAIREGRTVFENIRRFVVYLLSGNLGEIAAVTITALLNVPIPLLPLQILFINLASDVFPAAALGVVEGDESVLDHPPREPGTPILDRRRWIETGVWSALVAATTLGIFAFALGPGGLEEDAAVTVSFMAFVIARLVHVFNMRAADESLFTHRIARSRAVWAALAVSFGLLLLGVYVPFLAGPLGVVTPDAQIWTYALIGGLGVLVIGQLGLQIGHAVFGLDADEPGDGDADAGARSTAGSTAT